MKLGADRKKVVILGALTAVAAYFLYSNVFSSPSGTSAPARPHAVRPSIPDASPAASSTAETGTPVNRKGTARSAHEFRPSWKGPKGVETSTIDPKLRLDLLAKVQAVELSPAERDIFRFGAAPAPATSVNEPRKIIPKTPAELDAEKHAPPPGPPQPPPPPPITLKYYGYTAQRGVGQKRAFFLDGEDIFVAAEGELVKRRYKIVRIGISSAVVEDTQFNSTQTLPLAPEESAG